ncbi:uncharacterized protein LOC129951543 [Eupeodes corollae]|uniref:uncharacterized protein LOC129951543 n=1 Tax=Eupeodes corollae TaxID=290404 RepID=UPI00248FF171|nr:uncharacterized protein LOC129951543 [Eupeodes corollae]
MDDDVCNLLREWGLENYIDIFKENAITSMSLPLLGASEIKEMLPVIGHRVLFMRNLEEWRRAMHPNASNSYESQEISSCRSQIQNETLSFSLNDILPGFDKIDSFDSTVLVENTQLTPQSIKNMESCTSSIDDLKTLLENSLEGKGLLSLNKNLPLGNIPRLRLVRIISTHILKKNPERNITASIYGKWTNDVVHLFPRENRSVYFHNKIIDSGHGIVNRLAGKLPDHIHNLKRKYRDSGLITKRKHSISSSPSSTRSSTPIQSSIKRLATSFDIADDEDTAEEDLEWLRNSSHPWQTVEEKWEKTINARLRLLTTFTITNYFDEYPALKNGLGYKLLEKDFNTLHSENCKGLTENFPKLKRQIYGVAETKLKGNNLYIQKLISLENLTENTSNIGAFLLIPTLLMVSTIRLRGVNKKVWRPSKSEVRESFITHVYSDAEVDQSISLRREKLQELGLTLQPYILIVGTSLDKIKSYFVVINEIKYVFNSIIEAVDICFKIIFMINAEYPAESKSTWMFIQKAFFKLSTTFDKESTAANTLLAQLGIDEQ